MKLFPHFSRIPRPLMGSVAAVVAAVAMWRLQPDTPVPAGGAPEDLQQTQIALSSPQDRSANRELTENSPPDSGPPECCGGRAPAAPAPAPASPAQRIRDAETVARFDDWATRYASAGPSEQPGMIEEGQRYAQERREVMTRLIQEDPRTAIEFADRMPPLARRGLPASIAKQVENPVSGRGDLQVIGVLGGDQPYKRTARIGGEVYDTYTYGKRQAPIPETDTALIGFALPIERKVPVSGGQTVPRQEKILALREDPYRALSKPEIALARQEAPSGEQHHCAVSGAETTSNGDETAVDVGGKIVWLCKNGHIAPYLQKADGSLTRTTASGTTRRAAQGDPGEGAGAFPSTSSGWNTGSKRVAVLITRFPEQASNPFGSTNISAAVSGTVTRLNQWSYGRVNLTSTVSSILTLPRSEAQYASNGGEDAMMRDAITAADAQGYNASGANFQCLIFSGSYGNYCGLGQIVGGWSWIKCIDPRTITHELGHNLGLPHANAWTPLTSNPLGAGSHSEYGGAYSVMGSDDAAYDTMERFYLRWLTLNEAWNVATTGSYRIYDPEVTGLTAGRKHTIRVSTNDGNYYFVEFRPRATALAGNGAVNTNTVNGVRILRTDGAQQIDVTPGSANGTQDAGVTVGGSFTDPSTGVTIAPSVKGGSGTDQYMDVQVTFASPALYSGGVYELAPQCAPSKRLDVSGGADANNQNVQIWSSNDGDAQHWKLEAQTGGSWELIPMCAPSRRLDVLNAGSANGTNVQIYADNNGTAQRWTLTSVGNGYYELAPQCATGSRLDVSGSGTTDGSNVQIYGANSSAAQRWRLIPARVRNGAVYEMEPQCAPGKRLDVAGVGTAAGTNVWIWTAAGGANQKWKMEDRGNGLWEITPMHSTGTRLDVNGGGTGDGTNVQIWTDNDQSPQRWWAADVGGGYFELIPQVNANARLDVSNSANADGANAQIWTSNSSAAQRWRLYRN